MILPWADFYYVLYFRNPYSGSDFWAWFYLDSSPIFDVSKYAPKSTLIKTSFLDYFYSVDVLSSLNFHKNLWNATSASALFGFAFGFYVPSVFLNV